jgi:hypothetical protein
MSAFTKLDGPIFKLRNGCFVGGAQSKTPLTL